MDQSMALSLAIGIMEKHGVAFQIRPDKKEARAAFGSSAVYIQGGEWGTGSQQHTCVALHAFIAHDMVITPDNRLDAYEWINQRNSRSRFGRYVLRETPRDEEGNSSADAVLEFELRASDMQDEEFMHVLRSMWNAADHADGQAVERFGGKTHAEENQGQSENEDIDEVVDA